MNSIQSVLLHAYRFFSESDVIVGTASKLGAFCLPINQKIVIGRPLEHLKELLGYADTFFRIERVTCNSPCEGFVYFSELKAANIHLTIGNGLVDSFDYSSVSSRRPNLSLKNVIPAGGQVSVFGRYSGFVPKGLVSGAEFNFNVTFHGTAYTFHQI